MTKNEYIDTIQKSDQTKNYYLKTPVFYKLWRFSNLWDNPDGRTITVKIHCGQPYNVWGFNVQIFKLCKLKMSNPTTRQSKTVYCEN